MNTPILFIIFKRYDTALQVFQQIRKTQPPRLYFAADAPRNEEEIKECELTRSLVNQVDWDCEVKTLFQSENQGCGVGPYKAISWFFENEEQGIILEDDCVPNQDFFEYCEQLLTRYKDDDRISVITGRNVLGEYTYNDSSYFLSGLHFCWGWASWRRTWKHYDYSLKNIRFIPYMSHLVNLFGCRPLLIMWRLSKFMQCKLNPKMDAWDYQFAISTQMRETYTIVPKVNLVHNVGFDDRATHTSTNNHEDIPSFPIIPLQHPSSLIYNSNFDNKTKRIGNNIVIFLLRFVKTFVKYIFK